MKPKLITGGIHYDNRGFLIFSNEFKFNTIQRFYIVSNFQNKFVRAWHGHKKEAKFIMCIQGSFQISCVQIKNFVKPDKKSKILSWVLNEHKPEILYIPSGYANGNMSLSNNAKLLIFSTSTLEESLQDDYRFDSRFWDPWVINER